MERRLGLSRLEQRELGLSRLEQQELGQSRQGRLLERHRRQQVRQLGQRRQRGQRRQQGQLGREQSRLEQREQRKREQRERRKRQQEGQQGIHIHRRQLWTRECSRPKALGSIYPELAAIELFPPHRQWPELSPGRFVRC